jgi:aconitate hydratase
VTAHLPDGEQMTIFDAAVRYQSEGVPLVVLAGKEYGSGSSRDWAAKGPALLGVRAVLAESFERIHRSNLIGMGVLPLQFLQGENAESLGLTGRESIEVTGLAGASLNELVGRELVMRADGRSIRVILRVDTPGEAEYLWHGGILPYVVRALATG